MMRKDQLPGTFRVIFSGKRKSSSRTFPNPGYARTLPVFLFVCSVLKGLDGVVDPQVLVVFGDDFDLVFVIEDKVFQIIQQGSRFAQALSKQLQGKSIFHLGAFLLHFFTGFLLIRYGCVFEFDPSKEMFPLGVEAAYSGLNAIGDTDEKVVPKELGNVSFVVLEVFVVTYFDLLGGILSSIMTKGRPFT